MAKNVLICHIMQGLNKEIGTTKCKTFDKSFKYKKRIWAIDSNAIYYDKKGVGHYRVEINMADGTYRPHYEYKDNIVDDKCTKCGGAISIDALNVRALVNSNNIQSFWGRDSSHVLLLLILGIGLVIAIGALFFMVGENQKTNQLLAQYLKSPPSVVTANMILGAIFH